MAPIAKKAALAAGTTPLSLSIAVTAVAAAAALGFFGRSGLGAFSGYGWGAYARVLLVGVMGSGAVVVLAVYAMTETSATNRSLFQAMYPMATAVSARLLLGERLKPVSYVLITVMCLGLFLVNSSDGRLVSGRAFWLLAATLPLVGLSDVIARRSLRDAQPAFVTLGRLLFGLLALCGLIPFTQVGDWVTLVSHWPLVLAAGLAMAGGILGLYRAMDVAGASLAAAFVALAPVVTAAADGYLFGTAFSVRQLLGIALTVAAAAVLAARR